MTKSFCRLTNRRPGVPWPQSPPTPLGSIHAGRRRVAPLDACLRQGTATARMESSMAERQPAAPTHRAYSVIKREGQDDYWLNLGLAFPHKDGNGFNIILQ